MRDLISADLAGIVLDYNAVHGLATPWQFLASFDHPEELSRCHVTGCANAQTAKNGEKPIAPPWFFKGNGAHLRAHGESLTIPSFALSGAEEAELCGVWIIDDSGKPVRIGLTTGNEFSDPAMVKADPRMLSHSKIRTCAVGPELVVDAVFDDVGGNVRVERAGHRIWSRELVTGNAHVQFRLDEVELHLFKYPAHRVPGDVHLHYLGGSASSFQDGVTLTTGDQVVIEWDGFGRPLRNGIEQQH
jgi:hypothetical protein